MPFGLAGLSLMLRTCSCAIALSAMLVALSTAQAAEPAMLTLACQGTTTDWTKNAKPEPISMGVIINFTAETVHRFTPFPPLDITAVHHATGKFQESTKPRNRP